LDEWIDGCEKRGLRPKTVENYRQVVENHLKPALGRHRLEKLTQHHIQMMLDDMRERGLKLSSIGFYRNVIRAALTRAMKQDLVSRNVATLVDLPTPPKEKKTTLSAEGATAILQAVEGDRLEAFYMASIMLGLRLGEARGLQWGDIDFEDRILNVRQQLVTVGGVTTFGPPKSDAGERSIPIPAPLVDALKRHQARQLEERLVAGGRWQDSWQLVFCSRTGSPLAEGQLRKHLKATLEKLGLDEMNWHGIRHSTSSILAGWGFHTKVVQAILGHSDAQLTLERYTHAEKKEIKAATDQMGSLIGTENEFLDKPIATEM
jgi:integrase